MLIASPYTLPWGSAVYAKVSATNIKGTSPSSNVSSGGIIQNIPDTPTNFANFAGSTSATTIGLIWLPGQTYYGAPVLDYQISYDQGLGDGSIVVLEINILTT